MMELHWRLCYRFHGDGFKKSIGFWKKNENLKLEVYFIYDENGKWKTYTLKV
jgi:hypothetical protein